MSVLVHLRWRVKLTWGGFTTENKQTVGCEVLHTFFNLVYIIVNFNFHDDHKGFWGFGVLYEPISLQNAQSALEEAMIDL